MAMNTTIWPSFLITGAQAATNSTKVGVKTGALDGIMNASPVVQLLLVIMIFALSFGVSGLLILHLYLCFVGKTTMEHLREKYLMIPNPFDRGWKRNLIRSVGALAHDRAAFTATFDPLIVAFERGQRKEFSGELNDM